MQIRHAGLSFMSSSSFICFPWILPWVLDGCMLLQSIHGNKAVEQQSISSFHTICCNWEAYNFPFILYRRTSWKTIRIPLMIRKCGLGLSIYTIIGLLNVVSYTNLHIFATISFNWSHHRFVSHVQILASASGVPNLGMICLAPLVTLYSNLLMFPSWTQHYNCTLPKPYTYCYMILVCIWYFAAAVG